MSASDKCLACINGDVIFFKSDDSYTLRPYLPPISPCDRVFNNILILKACQDIFRAILI